MKSINSKKSSESTHTATPFLSGDNKKGRFFPSSFQNHHSFFGPSAIQPKLEIGQPDDKYEREADRVADTVMRMPDPQIQRQPVEEEEEELQMKRENTLIQRKCEECEEEEKLQKKSDGNSQPTNTASSNISSKLASQAGTGHRLPKPVRSEMTHKMGADFSGVNIHTGPAAYKLNRQLGARAFTHGSDIYFNKGEYNPDSSEGKHLLAHELTHVVQQIKRNSAGDLIQKNDGPTIGPVTPEQSRQQDEVMRTIEIQVVAVSMLGPLLKIDFRIRRKGHVRWIDANFFGGGPGLGVTIPLIDTPGSILERTVPHPVHNVTDLFGRAFACVFSVPRTNASGLILRLTSGPASIGYADVVWTIPGIPVGGTGCYAGRFEGGHGI